MFLCSSARTSEHFFHLANHTKRGLVSQWGLWKGTVPFILCKIYHMHKSTLYHNTCIFHNDRITVDSGPKNLEILHSYRNTERSKFVFLPLNYRALWTWTCLEQKIWKGFLVLNWHWADVGVLKTRMGILRTENWILKAVFSRRKKPQKKYFEIPMFCYNWEYISYNSSNNLLTSGCLEVSQ